MCKLELSSDVRYKLITLWNCYWMPKKAPLTSSRKLNCLVSGVEQTTGTTSDPLPCKMKVNTWYHSHRQVHLDRVVIIHLYGFLDELWHLYGFPDKHIMIILSNLGIKLLHVAHSSHAHHSLHWFQGLASNPSHTTWAGLKTFCSLDASLLNEEKGICTFTTWAYYENELRW